VCVALFVVFGTANGLVPDTGGWNADPVTGNHVGEPYWMDLIRAALSLLGMAAGLAAVTFAVYWRAFIIDDRKAAAKR
jgi:hypothetical protein